VGLRIPFQLIFTLATSVSDLRGLETLVTEILLNWRESLFSQERWCRLNCCGVLCRAGWQVITDDLKDRSPLSSRVK